MRRFERWLPRRSEVSRVRAIRLRWWEAVLLLPPALVSVLYLVGAGEQVLVGVVLAALVVVGVASRAEIRERNIAGGFARTRGYLQFVKALALLAIYCA